jgi:putative transposase
VIEAAFTELRPLVGTKGACHAVGRPRASHYRRGRAPLAGPPRPRPTPPNALSGPERAAVLRVLHGERFVDRAPAQIWATLLDEGTYLASESTMYRLLRADGEVRERRRMAAHPPRTVPELVADAPNRVWSYDATALRGPARGIWYDLFVMLDIFSRYCPGWLVVEGQAAEGVRDSDRAGRGGRGAHPRGHAHHPCRPRLADDLQGHLRAARRPAHRAHPRPAPRE